MKPTEAATLLTIMARTDKRTFGEAEAISWAELMTKADVPPADAIEAVRDHFGSSHEYLMPIHIIERVRAIRRERLTRAGIPPIPGDLTQADERAWRQLWCAAVKDGNPDPAGVANRAMKIPPQLEAVSLDRAERERLITKLAESKAIPKTKPQLRRKRIEFVADTKTAS